VINRRQPREQKVADPGALAAADELDDAIRTAHPARCPQTLSRAGPEECDDRIGRRTCIWRALRLSPHSSWLAHVLARHRLTAKHCAVTDFVFATRTGRPLQQRNVARALREAQVRATDEDGRPTFSILYKTDTDGSPLSVPRGTLPSMHSFRHTVASRALVAGESVDEVAFLLGHRDGTVTRTVYVGEVADARRRALRRSRMAAEYAGALRVALDDEHGSE
jgi:integrase